MTTGESVVHRSIDLAKLSNALSSLKEGRRGCFADFFMQALRSRFSISKDIESTTALLVQWILLY
jgi:hypothetical protein